MDVNDKQIETPVEIVRHPQCIVKNCGRRA